MESFKCPFCDHYMSISEFTTSNKRVVAWNDLAISGEPYLTVYLLKCPNCKEMSIIAFGCGIIEGEVFMIRPSALYKKFPEYIPEQIRGDYVEACKIITGSPKAAAALCRRCLQGMIRDFWGVSEPTLYREIDAIKSVVPPSQWKAINALRELGNIGAHMEKDVNIIIDILPEEAVKLLMLIEKLLSDWYVERHENEELYASIVTISESK